MHQFLYLHWDQDPKLFGLPISWYGLLFASSFAIGYWLMARIVKKEGAPTKWLDSLTIYMGVSTVVGARLGHCLFYDPVYYLSHPWEILMVWEGGLASHGAAVGIITGMYLWSRYVGKRSVFWILDRVVIFVALSGLFIRTGNLMNSEILGEKTTQPWGMVFHRADQSDGFRAKWKGEDAEVRYQPPAMAAEYFSIFRVKGDSILRRLPGPAVAVAGIDGGRAFQFTDRGVGDDDPITYLSALRGRAETIDLARRDSNDVQRIQLVHEFGPQAAKLGGEWKGDSVVMQFELFGANAGYPRAILLLRSTDGENWQLLRRGSIDGSAVETRLRFADKPTAGQSYTYMVLEKEEEILLVARHPSMMYEAFAYTAIFVWLLWLYYRKDGKIEYGLFFGYFLILVFGMRILIEFTKEPQEAFNLGIPLNMGQLLSVPFVLAGVYFVWRAKKRGYVHEPFPKEVEKK